MGKHDQESAAVGARRATGAAAGRGRGGRFSAGRKRETVLRLLRGEDLESVSRALGITAARASHWRDQFLAAGQAGLKSRAPDARDDDHRRLQAKIGELLMETELLYAKVDQLEAGSPLAPAEVDAMSGAHSISTRRAYGVQRICRVWERARSSVYARRHATKSRAPRCRRGPVGAAPDAVLGGHIRRVLEASPFHGEGYRKAWAKLRVAGIRTSKERVRRVNAGARPPGPAPRGPRARPEGTRRHDHHGRPRCDVGNGHDGHGDHRRGVGVCVRGGRSLYDRVHRPPCGQAREPVRGPGADPPGRPRTLRRIGKGVAHGLRLRHDHGSNYLADDFQQEVAFFGIESSPSFVRSPKATVLLSASSAR